jgi:hypothetical protein
MKRFILITLILLVCAAAPILPQTVRPTGHIDSRDGAPPPSP